MFNKCNQNWLFYEKIVTPVFSVEILEVSSYLGCLLFRFSSITSGVEEKAYVSATVDPERTPRLETRFYSDVSFLALMGKTENYW